MENGYYTPPEPINKPEKTMRLRYVGDSLGIDELTDGKIYEAWEEDNDYYRVIDDSGEDYLYPKMNPAINHKGKRGRWEIIEK